jgi:hypothetical protein
VPGGTHDVVEERFLDINLRRLLPGTPPPPPHLDPDPTTPLLQPQDPLPGAQCIVASATLSPSGRRPRAAPPAAPVGATTSHGAAATTEHASTSPRPPLPAGNSFPLSRLPRR